MPESDSPPDDDLYRFSFVDGELNIDVRYPLTLAEPEVRINGRRVTIEGHNNERGLLKPVTAFSYEQTSYTVEFRIVSALKGPFLCTLLKSGKPVARKSIVFMPSNASAGGITRQVIKLIILPLALYLGLIACILVINLPSPWLYIMIALGVVPAVLVWRHQAGEERRHAVQSDVMIEDEGDGPDDKYRE